MADPLSVSASIAGLVTLADIVFGRTYMYVKAVKKSSKEILALSTEVGALYGVLNNLHLVSRQLEHEHAESTTRIHLIHSCYQTLERIRSILDRDDTSSLHEERLETLKRKLRWPFTSSEVKDLITEIERHKSTLGLALNVDCMSGLLQALSKHDEIRDTVEEIRTELKERRVAETRIAITKETEGILITFAKVDPRSNHEMSKKLRSPGTGLWLTEGQDFRQWMATKKAKLWLYGIPGAGKTVLASAVIEEALRTVSPSVAIAYFYCDYKDQAKQDLSNILGSLAQQFAKQDEESFAKLREFYETHNPEHRPEPKYETEALLDLVKEVTLNYNCAMVIVDGLDECGKNTTEVVEALISLSEGEDTTTKTLFLSRDEIEIRERLEGYTKISIAATSSDLRLYVGAEIEVRMRKKKLRIRDQSLQAHIVERLVEGADGMFRWVACQMDYMCELPNDAARRKALECLPPDLKSTYERILNRVNDSNPDTQKLVQRALRWVSNAKSYRLSNEALYEAVSIELGSTKGDAQAIPDEFEILRWCSSLVRKSVYNGRLELAHFTVEEFLKQIDPEHDISISAYRVNPRADTIIIAKVCLTYLNFEDFNQDCSFDQQLIEHRFSEYPLRQYALDAWSDTVRKETDDGEIIFLLQKLFSPSKPNTFVSWMHDITYHREPEVDELFQTQKTLSRVKCSFAETTALHWAAMFRLAKVCSWLIRSGCDVNRNTMFGTPLHCALLGPGIIELTIDGRSVRSLSRIGRRGADDFSKLLLDAGADPNCYLNTDTEKISPLGIALSFSSFAFVPRLLDKGGILDNRCFDILESRLKGQDTSEPVEIDSDSDSDPGSDTDSDSDSDLESIYKVINHLDSHNVQPGLHGRMIELALKSKSSSATRFLQRNKDLALRDTHYEQMLRTAATIGQVDVVSGLLEYHKLDVDAAEEGTGLTALHQAARTDQLEVTQNLIYHGADWSRSDSKGRTALHHTVCGKGIRCLQLLLHQNADTDLRDQEGMTVWHLAAQEGHVQALRILVGGRVDSASAISFKANDGRTPLLCASVSQSKEAVSLPVSAGSNLTNTSSDGSSLLHYAAESGCVEVIKYLAAQAVDPFTVSCDGSNAVHYAIKGPSGNLVEIIDVLLELGVDPSRPRNDGSTPLHDLMKQIKEHSLFPDELYCLFTASRTLLRSLLEKSRLASHMELGSELIFLACSREFHNADEFVMALLQSGLNPNICFDSGRTALMMAAQKGNESIFSTLLHHGADPCVKDSNLYTALHHACLENRRSILVLLRDTGVDWNSEVKCTVRGKHEEIVTVLHIAARLIDSTVLKYLIDENLTSNINACTDYGITPLHVAICARAYWNLSILLSNGADPTLMDSFGNSVIHYAAKWGDKRVIEEFIRHGSDLGIANSLGLTPELLARKRGHGALAKTIMDYVNGQDHGSKPTSDIQRPERAPRSLEVLKVAIDLGDLEFCKRLVESGTDLNSGFDACFGCTPLLYSLHKEQSAIAECLVSQGASITGRTCEAWSTRGFSVFHYAAASGYVELLRLLLEKFPSEIYLSNDPIHPIHHAVLNDNAECVKLILDHASQGKGWTVSDQLGTSMEALEWLITMEVRNDLLCWYWYGTPKAYFPMDFPKVKPLHIAASQGYSHIVRMLLVHGASVDVEDWNLATPLHFVAANGHAATIRLLLDAGANPNAMDLNLYSPCMSAALNRQICSIQVLMKSGADLRLRNRLEETALHFAARQGAMDIFVLLMTRINLWLEDIDGLSVLYLAICNAPTFPMTMIMNFDPSCAAYEGGRRSILNAAIRNRSSTEIKMLLRRVPTHLSPRILNHRALDGTPLYIAATQARSGSDKTNLLLDAGAELELEGSEHGTPLMAACATGRLAVVKVLVARGARTSYVHNGRLYSVIAAAKYHPQVRRWLLVGRFLEGPKLLTCGEVE